MHYPTYFGYFDEPDQEQPTYRPSDDVLCPLCHKKRGPKGIKRADGKSNLVTISFMGLERDKSFFYAVHRDCYERATPEQMTEIESIVIDGGIA